MACNIACTMLPSLNGKWYRSENMAWQAGAQLVPRLAFLDPARQYTAPEVCEIVFRFSGTVGAVAGGALGRDAAKLIARINLRDSDDIVNASGAMMRVLEQVELGNKQQDPADITSGATNTTYNYHLRHLLEPIKAQRPRDFRLPLANLLEGGQLSILTAAALPTGWAAAQSDWKFQIWMRIIDGRVRELKSRRKILETNVTQQEYYYPVNGSLRCAILGSTLTTTGYTSLAGFTTINSQTLDLVPSMETDMFQDLYRRYSDSLGSNDECTLAANGALPIVVPSRWKKVGEMIDMQSLHLNLNAAAPTSGVLLTDTVIDRNPTMAALAMGYSSPDDLAAAAASTGQVVDSNGGSPVKSMVGKLARRLPVRIKGKASS